MHASRLTGLALLLAVAAPLILVGCGDDSLTGANPGSITITASPPNLDPGWTLTGPNDYERDGVGDEEIDGLVPGNYTLAWQDIASWVAPDTSTATLSTDGSITFAGVYTRVPAASPDALMAEFRTAYADRDLDFYQYLLGADFLFADRDGGTNDRSDEITIADRMFHEQAGDSGFIISNITINSLVPQENWANTPPDDPLFGGFVGSRFRMYLVDFSFWIAGQNLILRVQGPVGFYAVNYPEQGASNYKILGMVDATYGGKTTEDHSWTAVRALFD